MEHESIDMASTSIGVIGYGEVGKILCREFREKGAALVATWDLNFVDSALTERTHAEAAGLQPCSSTEDLVSRCDVVFSAVTAQQTLAVATEAAPHLRPRAVFIDLNSASPATKMECAGKVAVSGAHYVEAAVMAPVPPFGLRAPTLLGGPHAKACAAALAEWGMALTPVQGRVGTVSAAKLCRSLMIKGLEALVVEGYTAARSYGVEDIVLASWTEALPGIDWERFGSDCFDRVIRHGRRRAEEMRHCAESIADQGLASFMATAVAQRQDWLAALTEAGAFEGHGAGWRDRTDAVRTAVGDEAGDARQHLP